MSFSNVSLSRTPAPIRYELPERLRRCIGRTVVDDNNLVILESLPKNTINRFGDEAGPVVSRDDDRKHGARFRFRDQSP
jgi:hypothetical protein